jgi:hypothetical protein
LPAPQSGRKVNPVVPGWSTGRRRRTGSDEIDLDKIIREKFIRDKTAGDKICPAARRYTT